MFFFFVFLNWHPILRCNSCMPYWFWNIVVVLRLLFRLWNVFSWIGLLHSQWILVLYTAKPYVNKQTEIMRKIILFKGQHPQADICIPTFSTQPYRLSKWRFSPVWGELSTLHYLCAMNRRYSQITYPLSPTPNEFGQRVVKATDKARHTCWGAACSSVG